MRKSFTCLVIDLEAKSVYVFVNSGCVRRKLDAKKLSVYLLRNGYRIVDRPDKSDIIVLFGCGVTNEFADYSLNLVKRFQQYNAELIVTGCIPATDGDRLKNVFYGKKVSTKELDKIDEFFPDVKVRFSEVDEPNCFYGSDYLDPVTKFVFDGFLDKIYSFKVRNYLGGTSYKTMMQEKDAFIIRVGWGCLNNCAFCATKRAVGSLLSKPLEECVREFRKGLGEGYKYFVLTGDDTGAYGLDFGGSLLGLLHEITAISGDYEVFVVNLNPRWLVKYIDEMVLFSEKQMSRLTHFEIPIQSGSERVLKLMNRFHDVEKLKDVFRLLRKFFPSSVLETNVMLGFPTETDDDFDESLDFLSEVKFDYGYIMEFQCRPGTVAEKLYPKVSRKENLRRLRYAKKYLKDVGYRTMGRPFWHLNSSKALFLNFSYRL